MPPPPTPTQQPANQAYFNTILNPNPNTNQQHTPAPASASPSSASPSDGANTNVPTSTTTQTPTRTRTPGSSTKNHTPNPFTTTAAAREKEKRMRSAQARNKNYYDESNEGAARRGRGARSSRGMADTAGREPPSPESFEARNRREWAGTVLTSTELLVWYAGVRNEVR
ncbi:hypothetical protein DM02DRAFT_610394 [Periconia macrospinosa]|uniref:Uncharacterized protein n=1 Tax=Periconia macrospinosa TaxID=97972 RepID=A0A2V1E6F7_9PLEO|nr:hypothetical protein DM02DRAFT_610394 [Periconia macrospinosa]